jgi:tRNA-dihydrouridine synthase B
VTLKTRLGWDKANRNVPLVARIAEESGIQALAIHGRTRACMFAGRAEYETIAEVKSRVRIPVIANGDVESAQDAKRILELTGADGIMVGRAAQGRPWLFRSIARYLESGEVPPEPQAPEIGALLREHLEGLYDLYGAEQGARVARKHIGWTVRGMPGGEEFRSRVVRIDDAGEQYCAVNDYFAKLAA